MTSSKGGTALDMVGLTAAPTTEPFPVAGVPDRTEAVGVLPRTIFDVVPPTGPGVPPLAAGVGVVPLTTDGAREDGDSTLSTDGWRDGPILLEYLSTLLSRLGGLL